MTATARTLCLLTGLLLAVTACRTGGGEFGEPDYAKDAETNIKRGNEALDSSNYLDAEKYFEYVKRKFPFLEASKEAELRLADTFFAKESYAEARDAYQNFVKIHPTHPKVDYAAYRAALTFYKEIPSDLFFLPPAYEKDQVAIRNTLSSMGDFLRQYPDSKYAADGKKVLDEAKKQMAQHELYAAAFYRKRERPAAVVTRLKTLLEKYSGVGYDERALFELHEAYVQLKDAPRAKATLEEIIQKFPNTPSAARAKRLLGAS
jgi:outer membrane protein assembly factor BamD